MIISEVLIKMIESSDKNYHDINHFIKMHSLAKAIGEIEGLSEKEQMTLEIASIIHDIACPLCREKYGNTNGENQEKEEREGSKGGEEERRGECWKRR